MKDEWIRVYIKQNLTGFTGLMGFSFACSERPFGRRPFFPDDLVDPVQLLSENVNPFLTYIRFNIINQINSINR